MRGRSFYKFRGLSIFFKYFFVFFEVRFFFIQPPARLCNKKIPVPAHLCRCQELGNLALLMLLVLMCIYEPIWWCVGDMYGNYPGAGLFTTMCPAATVLKDTYVVLACAAMILYCILILDLSIVSMRISAFVLVCGRVFEEVRSLSTFDFFLGGILIS